MVLPIELEEQAERRPRQVDPRDERPVPVDDLELACRIGQSVDTADELDHNRLEEALGGRGTGRPSSEHTPHPSHTGCSRAPELWQRGLDVSDRRQPLAQRGLESLLPPRVVEIGGQIHERLKAVRAAETIDDDDATLG
jgi:hypothetical protein